MRNVIKCTAKSTATYSSRNPKITELRQLVLHTPQEADEVR